jgi:hypothetical protein
MAVLGYKARWKLISVRWKTTVILTQDRCTVWAKQTMVLETISDAAGNSKVTWVIWNVVLVLLEIVLVSV